MIGKGYEEISSSILAASIAFRVLWLMRIPERGPERAAPPLRSASGRGYVRAS
jgi:hypothetical protein